MESVIKDQLVSYLHSKNLITSQQHAFIKRHSTVTNLLECTHDWSVAVHGGHAVDVIYIDFSRAFDSVVHSKLIFKLSNLGISGELLQWIEAFLTDRCQCVVVEHCFSSWTPVVSGVAQGSVLGPILFILFINDIGCICNGCTVSHKLFADDLKLYSTINTNCDHVQFQAVLNNLQQWCIDWQLNINPSKCNIIHFGHNNNKYTYFLNGSPLNAPETVTDLGVDVDPLLKFDHHINKIIKKAYSRIGILFKGFASREVQLLKQAYITYIRPVLEYASSVWSPHLLKHINSLERVQKYFTKHIPSLRQFSYPERLALIGLEPLEVRRLKFDLILYYKSFNNLIALPHNLYFSVQSNLSQTRTGGNRLIPVLCNTNTFANDFFNRCVNCYNSLPLDVINSHSLSVFKNYLSHIDLANYIKCSYLQIS